MPSDLISDPLEFSAALYPIMRQVDPAVAGLDLREFRYCLEPVTPSEGWDNVNLIPMESIARQLEDPDYYRSIQLKPVRDCRPVMDAALLNLLQSLLAGLATGAYPLEWVRANFFFDVRAFCFFHPVQYLTPAAVSHLGGRPYRVFEAKQNQLAAVQSVGYPEFKAANAEVDACFTDILLRLAGLKGIPLIIAIAGQTAAGKTEITARLHDSFHQAGHSTTTLELDNFFTDRDFREAHGIDSLGKQAMHFDLLLDCIADLTGGRQVITPNYDFITATSSHDLQGRLRPGCSPVSIEPADIIFMEGNFPFLLPEIAPRVGIKAVYLTGDAVRMKRKWRRDMDYRRKYDLYYFINRYFREQFLMAQQAYIPQLEVCDLFVDTTAAAIWVTPQVRTGLEGTTLQGHD